MQRPLPQPVRPRHRRGPLRRGAAAVEFAFSASIVFFLFLAMIEVARFHVVRHSLDQAVYQGARTGIVPGATVTQVTDAVRNRLSIAGVINPTVTVTPAVITNATRTITVRAACSYAQNSWTLPKFFNGMDVVAEMTLDHENVAFVP
jgi:Flp pilus assembly protein TadG